MSGIFEELEMFDEGDKVVTRQAIAAATKRLNDNFGGFLRQASTKKEFESRLALVDTDINNMVADVVNEYGGDADKITSAVKETVKTAFTPTTPPADESSACKNCGNDDCEGCSDDSKTASKDRPEHLKAQDEVQLADEHSQVNPWLKKQIQDEDQEDGGNLRNKEAASDKCEACDCEPCECDKHEDKTAAIEDSQPVSEAVPLTEANGTTAGGQSIDKSLAEAPSAVGTGPKTAFDFTFVEGEPEPEPSENVQQLKAKFDNWFQTQPFPDELRNTCLGEFDQAYEMARQNRPDFEQMNPEAQFRALIEEVFRIFVSHPHQKGFPPTPNGNPILGKTAAAHTVEKKDDKFVVVEDGGEEAAGPFDSQEEAYARANELNDLENLEKEATIKQADRPGEPPRIMPEARCTGCNGTGRTPIGPGMAVQERCKQCNGLGTENKFIQNDELTGENNPNVKGRVQGEYPSADQIPSEALERLKNNQWQRGQQVTTATMEKALALKEAAARGEKRIFFSNKPTVCPQCQMETEPVIKEDTMGPEKVCPICDADMTQTQNPHIAAKPETGDSTEKNEKLPTGNEDAHDGPSPKIDKTKWKPNATNPDGNLKPIDTEGENSPHPTRQMDIKQKPDYQQDTLENLKKYDNNVWEREQLPSADDNAGFDDTRNIEQLSTKTFSDKGQTDAVTREALSYLKKVAIFEDERSIIEKHIPKDWQPWDGFWNAMADAKASGASDEEINDLWLSSWRVAQDPNFLKGIGITPWRSEHEETNEALTEKFGPDEDKSEDNEESFNLGEKSDDSLPEESVEEVESPSIDESISIDEGPEGIEEIIERGDDDGDRVEVIHDDFDDEEEKEKDPLGFDDPDELDEFDELDEDIPFDEELSEEELDKLLREEEKEKYDDEDLFL